MDVRAGTPAHTSPSNESEHGTMTAAASPEVLLFASTTQSFLDKEVPLSRVRELHQRRHRFRSRVVAAGSRTGLGEPAGARGARRRQRLRRRRCRPGAGGRAQRQDGGPRPAASGQHVLAGLADAEDGDRHAELIEALVSGEAIASWAVYEPGQQWNPLQPSVTATPTATGFRIDGVKDRVEAGADSDLLLVVANVDGAPQAVPGPHRRARGRRRGTALASTW